MNEKSNQLFKRATRVIPGGVNSPVRAFTAVDGEPVFIERAEGARVHDVDGREYIDFVGSWGPSILGHAHPAVVAAVKRAADRGLTFGAPTEAEVVLAERITEAFPAMDSVRLVSSGTEATMSAIRVARGYTRRNTIIKFEGCYHGHVDSLLVQAGSGALTIPGTPGIPDAVVQDTIVVPYNDASAVQEVVESRGDDIACVIVEPIAGNMGLVPPQQGYLELLRELTQEYGILLIFDEVITGFRVAYGGAQTTFGIAPDLTALGKIIGGGMPVGAYGGRKEVMDQVAPVGPVYQAGTLSGNPVATAAGLATLRELANPAAYVTLERLATRWVSGLRQRAEAAGVPVWINQVGSALTLFFNEGRVTDFPSAKRSDTAAYARFFHAMLEAGVYLPPSQFETMFLSLAHTEADIDQALEAARSGFARAAQPS